MDIKAVQKYLSDHELDGWLMADFHGRNTIAIELLRITGMISRRFFYFIPTEGEPTALVHNIEKDKFTHVEGKKIFFSGYIPLEEILKKMLSGLNRIAMEYTPQGRLPYIGLVDAGTVELVRSFGCKVESSADLVANFQARLSPEEIAAHRIAAKNIIEIKEHTFDFIRQSLTHGKVINEFDVVQDILYQFEKFDMESYYNPNCSVNANAGNPHYEPKAEKSSLINKGDLILIDLWGKIKHEHGVFADITWMAYAGKKDEIPEEYKKKFEILASARDTAVNFVRKHIDSRSVYGSEVDDVCRKVITDAGYGDLFVHRTGHSIGTDVHGTGPNIDNLETEDNRKLQQGHLFSIEPGIYTENDGFRTEINVLITHNGAEVTTLPIQTEILALLE